MFRDQGGPPGPTDRPWPKSSSPAWSPRRDDSAVLCPRALLGSPCPGAVNQRTLSPASAAPKTRPPRRPPRHALGGPCLPFPAAPGRPSPSCSEPPAPNASRVGLASTPVTSPHGIRAVPLGCPPPWAGPLPATRTPPHRGTPQLGAGAVRTHWPRDVCTSRVMRVDVAGQMQFRASMAYLHSSSHTTWSAGGMVRGCRPTADDPPVPHLRGRLLLTCPRRCPAQVRPQRCSSDAPALPLPSAPALADPRVPGSRTCMGSVPPPALGEDGAPAVPRPRFCVLLSSRCSSRSPQPWEVHTHLCAHGPPICVPANLT